MNMFRGVFVSKYIEKYFSLGVGLLMVACMIFIARKGAQFTGSNQVITEEGPICIVLDAGHGGFDPGKVGVTGQKEAEINLCIALKVRDYLEANDIKVVMTRETEAGLYDENADNKKVQDMKRRIAIMEEAAPLACISIHQNSYTQEYVNGAQVFYYAESREGKQLAGLLQESLRKRLNPDNHRTIKANDSYYLLKKTVIPTVIVECGFLSNYNEASLLEDEEYQDRVAWAIHMGIMQYIRENKK